MKDISTGCISFSLHWSVCCKSCRISPCCFRSGWSTTEISKPRRLAPRWLSQLFELDSSLCSNMVSGYSLAVLLKRNNKAWVCTQHSILYCLGDVFFYCFQIIIEQLRVCSLGFTHTKEKIINLKEFNMSLQTQTHTCICERRISMQKGATDKDEEVTFFTLWISKDVCSSVRVSTNFCLYATSVRACCG